MNLLLDSSGGNAKESICVTTLYYETCQESSFKELDCAIPWLSYYTLLTAWFDLNDNVQLLSFYLLI